jgi:hypothetical protein
MIGTVEYVANGVPEVASPMILMEKAGPAEVLEAAEFGLL